MLNASLVQEIESLVSNFESIPVTRKYWLVRTQAGEFYESFKNANYIAIGHNEIKYSQIVEIKNKANSDEKIILNELRSICEKTYKDEKRPGLIASQIYKFIFQIKKDDIVIIPSENSEEVAIGIITATPIIEITDKDIIETKCPYLKRKSVKWINILRRKDLDPYLYRVLLAHQAINEVSNYSDIIERIIGNFYIKGNEGNLVLNVMTNDGINAVDLFQLGYYLLINSSDYFNSSGLPFDVNDVEVKINLNSKGKIQFKAPNAKTIWLIAVMVIAINGGGLKFKTSSGIDFDLSTDGIMKNITDYLNNNHDREMTQKIMQSMDSLKVQTPDDAVKVFQQFNTNKK